MLLFLYLFLVGNHTSTDELMEFLLSSFPKLRSAGGFELLRISGMTRSRQLLLIPCPNKGYDIKFLKDPRTQIGNAIIFIRPLQRNLNLDPVSIH